MFKDNNVGIVKQVIASLTKKRIQKLTKVKNTNVNCPNLKKSFLNHWKCCLSGLLFYPSLYFLYKKFIDNNKLILMTLKVP